jgi:hypothetical protein
MRRASLTGGVGLALMAALAGFAVFGVISTMIIPGDAIATAQRITASSSLFRIGIAGLIVVIIVDVIVAVALFTVFSRTDRMVSAMAAGFRIAYHHLGRGADPLRRPPAADRAPGPPVGVHAEDLRRPAGDRRLGYLVDGFGAVLVQDYAISIGQFTFVGEWL